MRESQVGVLPKEQYVPDDRSEAYKMLADSLKHVAEKCGVTLDQATYVRWQQAGALMREFDTIVDEGTLGKDVDPMTVLRNFSFFASRYPDLTPKVLGDETFDDAVANVGEIVTLGQEIATTTDVNEYIELRKFEAYYTSKAFIDLATPEVKERNEQGFNEFAWRLTGLSITANLGDSLLDARNDFRTGKTALAPSWELYKGLAFDAARHGRRHVRYVLDPEGAVHRARMMSRRIHNRWTSIREGKGIPEYSNLRMIMPNRVTPLATLSESAPVLK